MKHILPFRQVHLDFHTSPDIPGIGELFDKREWQETLKRGHVNSITVFSKCHHGLSYHPTKVGKMHPHLKFDLLRAQVDACAEIGVKTPVYLSAGIDDVAAFAHPEWREMGFDSKVHLWAGFKKLCFNSPYIEYLCEQIKEATLLFPEANGIFLDIIHQGQCICQNCLNVMKREGLNPLEEADRLKCAQIALKRYYDMTTAATKFHNKNMPIFHNSGHIITGRRDIVGYDSHLELESLPTGGWGYDHFPMSAAYCRTLGMDMLGMTGKFHTTWGEFGGFKHPNALKFECDAMIAQGAKCSVGDQLHPSGKLDISTYELIGEAYKDVEEKESWCENAVNITDVALLSANATRGGGWGRRGDDHSDVGAARMLLESHILFNVVDQHDEIKGYKLLIVPEDAVLDASMLKKINAHLAAGGKLVLCGKSAFDATGKPLFDFGVKSGTPSEFEPDYILPAEKVRPSFVKTPFVMYFRGMRVKAGKGAKSLGQVFDPYFNRTIEHYCSHQHTPPKTEPSGYDCGVLKGNILYLAHPVFTIYRGFGAVAVRDYFFNALKLLLGEGFPSVEGNLPSAARVTLAKQAAKRRYVLHAFFANTSVRGGRIEMSGGNVVNRTNNVEVIEELLPLCDVELSVRVKEKVRKVVLEPEGKALDFTVEDGAIKFKLDRLLCHAMVSVEF
jgi:hypothetical protein